MPSKTNEPVNGTDYIAEKENVDWLEKDNLKVDKQLKGEMFRVIPGHSVVYKMGSIDHPGNFCVYKPKTKQGDLEQQWGPEVWIKGESKPDREVAAYIVSDELGFDCVPKTIMREGPDGEGSVQVWVNGIGGKNFDMGTIPENSLVEKSAFIHLIGGIDTHPDNFIKDESEKLWMTDNGLSFPEMESGFYNNYEINLKCSGKPIPEETLAKIQQLFDGEKVSPKGEEIISKLLPHLNEKEIEFVFLRGKSLLINKTIPNPLSKKI